VLRHVSILIDHHQGVCLYLAKVTEYLKFFKNFKNLKNTEFKIPTINSGVVAAIHVAGVRGDPCGAVQRTAPHTSLHWKQRTHKYTICRHIAHNNEIFIILTRDFSKQQYVLPEDNTRYAIETCRSILSVLV